MAKSTIVLSRLLVQLIGAGHSARALPTFLPSGEIAGE